MTRPQGQVGEGNEASKALIKGGKTVKGSPVVKKKRLIWEIRQPRKVKLS